MFFKKGLPGGFLLWLCRGRWWLLGAEGCCGRSFLVGAWRATELMARCACFIYPLRMLEKGAYVSGALFFDHPFPETGERVEVTLFEGCCAVV